MQLKFHDTYVAFDKKNKYELSLMYNKIWYNGKRIDFKVFTQRLFDEETVCADVINFYYLVKRVVNDEN